MSKINSVTDCLNLIDTAIVKTKFFINIEQLVEVHNFLINMSEMKLYRKYDRNIECIKIYKLYDR